MRRLAILGSTGSIGVSTLDVAARHPDRYTVVALAANVQWQRLLEQCVRFRPRIAALLDGNAAVHLRNGLRDAGCGTEVVSGTDGVCAVGELGDVDTVIAAIVGAAGLASTLAAARRGKRILLANKETLVLAG